MYSFCEAQRVQQGRIRSSVGQLPSLIVLAKRLTWNKAFGSLLTVSNRKRKNAIASSPCSRTKRKACGSLVGITSRKRISLMTSPRDERSTVESVAILIIEGRY